MWDIYGAAVSDNEKERKRNLLGQIHRMITERTKPLQRSEVTTVTDLLTECNVVNRDTGQTERYQSCYQFHRCLWNMITSVRQDVNKNVTLTHGSRVKRK